MPTKIEWTEETWNPITGCTKISEGCQNCYAGRMAKRLAGRFGYPADDPFKPGVFHRDRVDKPLRWMKPKKIFVCSMGDIFHKTVSPQALFEVFNVMASWALSCRKIDCGHENVECWHDPGHTYKILTKRPENIQIAFEKMFEFASHFSGELPLNIMRETDGWPLSNVWLGVTAENQKTADERIPILLQIPAAVRFVSVEPMLEFIDLSYWLNGAPEQYAPDRWQQTYPPLDWVIAGPETGPKARKADNEWFRDLHRQCFIARVPYFLKKTADGGRLLDGREWNEYPEVANDLRQE